MLSYLRGRRVGLVLVEWKMRRMIRMSKDTPDIVPCPCSCSWESGVGTGGAGMMRGIASP